MPSTATRSSKKSGDESTRAGNRQGLADVFVGLWADDDYNIGNWQPTGPTRDEGGMLTAGVQRST